MTTENQPIKNKLKKHQNSLYYVCNAGKHRDSLNCVTQAVLSIMLLNAIVRPLLTIEVVLW